MSLRINIPDCNSSHLQKLAPSKWKELRDYYLRDWPYNMVGYYTLDNFIRWIRIEPDIKNVAIYVLRSNNRDPHAMINATFLIVDRYQLFFNTLYNTNTNSLRRALSLLDWSPGYKVSTFLDRHKEIVLDIINEKGLTLEWGNSATPMGYFERQNAADLELNCPDDIDLRPLSEKDCEIADALWPNRHYGSLFLLKRLAKLNPSIGAFKRDTNELVAWCFQLQAGPLGALQVKEEHKRKGYGSLCVRAMVKILAANDCDTFACVSEGNDASFKLFKSCGFQFIDVCNWLRTNPIKALDTDWEKEYSNMGTCDELLNKCHLMKLQPPMWPELRDLYLENWPHNMVGYYTLDNFIRWTRLKGTIRNLTIYVLALNNRSIPERTSGSFIIIDRYQLFLNSLYGQDTKYIRMALHLLDWSPGYKVSTFLDRHKQIVKDVISEKSLTLEWGIESTPIAYFRKEAANIFEINCQNDINLRPLSQVDAENINKIWPNLHYGSLFFIKRIIELNPSIGAYKTNTDELVAWCLQLQSGALGVLQVKEGYKRKGYGSLVVQAMTKILAARNSDTFACVGQNNQASHNTFKKCGFEIIDGCNWLRTNPIKPLNINWEEE
ncbi:uncharacterized protein LOC129608380 [Condylostylus longicornis]|uniref:uncharacterized protein LOC129608380 n=1 Tax=Condylostylus longicornis TaxID=2530218 RepID=UPI00244DBF48|nr:uncharacterized protein LOC129608380 [Condylostylus longicornis]